MIMPAYNAQQYIEAAVRSILNQSFRDLRLIVVNDGSTDATGEILHRLQQEDSRLLALDTKNSGPAMARNRGLDAVTPGTEYVMFADADDKLVADAIEYAMEGAQGADMVFFGFTILNPDGSHSDYAEPEALLDRAGLGAAFGRLYKANLFNQVWAKLYRYEQIKDLRFPNYRWGEDRLFVFRCLERADMVRVLPECKYLYIMHPGESLITKFCQDKPMVCMEADSTVQALTEALGCDEATDADCRYMFAKSIFSCLTTMFSSDCPLNHREKLAYVRSIVHAPRVRLRCRKVFGGLVPNLLCAVVRSGIIWLNMLVFQLVVLAGRLSPKIFTKLKHRK
jgi:hypothetical protein